MARLKYRAVYKGLLAIVLVTPIVHTSIDQNSEMATILHRPIRSVSYPSSSNMGIFFALAVPLEDPLKSVSLSYFFEANYRLPINVSAFSTEDVAPGGRRRRSIDRSTVYAVIQAKFESAGFPGHECLLRSICEASEYPLEQNGILGDVAHVVFLPSSSKPEDHLPDGIIEAQLKGGNETCFDYYKLCPFGLFDLIGILQ